MVAVDFMTELLYFDREFRLFLHRSVQQEENTFVVQSIGISMPEHMAETAKFVQVNESLGSDAMVHLSFGWRLLSYFPQAARYLRFAP